MAPDSIDARTASTPAAPGRWQVLAGLGALALAAWLTALFFEGDSCGDAGGTFHMLAYRCELADGRHYVTLVQKARWQFWALYAAVTVLVATPLCALAAGLIGGIACGLHSLCIEVFRNPATSQDSRG